MNLLFLLPSLAYGVFLYASSGSPVLLMLSSITVAVWLLLSNQKRFDLQAAVSFREGRVWLGDKRLGRFPWLWSGAVRNLVYPALYPEPKRELDFAQLPSWAWGFTASGEALASPICRTSPHSLVIGQTGSGKTQLLIRAINAFDGDVVVLDLKGGGDFSPVNNREHLFGATDVDEVIQQVTTRMQHLDTPTLFVVDELGEAVKIPKLAAVIESVCAKGRSFGLHFFGASQTLTGISRTIWSNCQNRIAIRADSIDRVQLGLSAKPLNPETPGYAELSTPVLSAFYFPESTWGPVEPANNPLLIRAETKPWSEPGEEFVQFRRTPWDQ